MRSRIAMLTLALLLMVVPAFAQADQIFGFHGQAVVPDQIGGTLTMNGVVYDPPVPFTTPLPLDFANFQYTLVISDAELTIDGIPDQYTGTVVAIYEDDLTPADYADPSTFADGTAILIGSMPVLNHRLGFLNPLTGTFYGQVDWTGGSRLDDLAPEDQAGWFLDGSLSRNADDVEPGYTEAWNGKIDPPRFIVGSQLRTWSSVRDPLR